jgi:hypothetical protein
LLSALSRNGFVSFQPLLASPNSVGFCPHGLAGCAWPIGQVIAQLREYAAYFEQEKYRKFVRDKYGLKIYRPRLIALVGRDMREMEKAETGLT